MHFCTGLRQFGIVRKIVGSKRDIEIAIGGWRLPIDRSPRGKHNTGVPGRKKVTIARYQIDIAIAFDADAGNLSAGDGGWRADRGNEDAIGRGLGGRSIGHGFLFGHFSASLRDNERHQ